MEYRRPIVGLISDQINQKLKDLETEIEPLATDTSDEAKRCRMSIKMEVNKKVSQISQASGQAKKIAADILASIKANCTTSATLKFYLLVLAQKLIEHGETLVGLHPSSAFTLSHVAVAVGRELPGFMDVLFACFYKQSVYTVPKYVLVAAGDSVEAARQLLGYREQESEEAYAERMSGVVYLFGAVLAAPFTDSRLVEYAWVWLASLLNTQPQRHTAAVLAAFLEVCSLMMFKTYGRQFIKIVLYIRATFAPMLPAESVAANTRLALLVDRFVREGFCLREGADLAFGAPAF